MSGILCAQTGGLPNYKGSATVTVGYYNISSSGFYADFWGFPNIGATPGSIVPTNWADSNLPIIDLDYRLVIITGDPSTVIRLNFIVTGYAPNMGWTTLDVAGTTYNRTAAGYSYDGTQTGWSWDASSTGNPFGSTVGATKVVTWS